MVAHPASFRPSRISKQGRLRRTKEYPCSEPRCTKTFTRDSDLQRHRKCVHDRPPTLGDKYVYCCAIPGCAARRKRLDHFRKHVKQAHADHDVEPLVRESAVPIVDSSPLSPADDAVSRQRSCDTRASHHRPASYAELRNTEDNCPTQAQNGMHDIPSTVTSSLLSSATRTSQLRQLATVGHDLPTSVADDYSSPLPRVAIVEGFRRLQANCERKRHCSDLPIDPIFATPTTEHEQTDIPVDGNDGNYAHSHGSFQGMPCFGNGGFGSGGGPGKGKQPIRGPGWPNTSGSDAGSNGISHGPEGRLPCVFCLFHGTVDGRTRHCYTRKRYICYLWPHHYRHNFACCWTCFSRFENREALERHRRDDNCTTPCLDEDCGNYDGPSTVARPCRHSGQYPQVVIWQRLYREAHHLTHGDWVPDPTLDHQNVPDNLPPHHPMFRWSQQVPPQAEPTAGPANHSAIPGPQFANMLAGIGGGVNGAPSNEEVDPPQVPRSDRDRLRSILEILWARVNRRIPSWSRIAEDFWRLVPPVDTQDVVAQPVEMISETRMLHVLAAHHAMIIEGTMPRTHEVWHEVRQLTIMLMGEVVEVPVECPWNLDEATLPAAHHPGPPTYRAIVRTPTIDHALESLVRSSLATLNGATGLVSTTSNDLQTIPQASIDATTDSWHVRPDESSQHLSPQTPMDRRPSLGSLTSPSDGPYYSARSSMNTAPFGRSSTPGSQYQGNAPPSEDLSEFLTDFMDEDEDEDEDETELDDID